MNNGARPLSGLSTIPFDGNDISQRTAALFQVIADTSGNALLQRTIGLINQHLDVLRPYESTFLSDRQAEYEALSRAWDARDMSLLRTLTAAYFQRRRDLIPQLSQLLNRPN